MSIPLVFDMTPTLINRTAIYHIARDSAVAAGGDVSKYRFGYELKESWDLPEREQARLQKDAIQFIFKGASTPRQRHGNYRLFYFDPLYVLWEMPQPSDVVLVLDLTTITNPEWHEPAVVQRYWEAYELALRSECQFAAISHNTALAMWANFGVPLDEITVVPLYTRTAFSRPDTTAEKIRNFLFVGSLELRKNLIGLIKGFERSNLASKGYSLTIAGGDGFGADNIRHVANSVLGVTISGFVSDSELDRLYRQSIGFAYPSFHEGFGLPLIEAMSYGLPVMTSITGAPPEIVGPSAKKVDPYDIRAIAEALQALAGLSSEELAAIEVESRATAEQFTFENYWNSMKGLLGIAGADQPGSKGLSASDALRKTPVKSRG